MSAVTDTTAIAHLVARYAELVDDGDFAGVGGLFADAVFIGSGAPVHGREGVERMLTDTLIRHEDGTPRTHHATSNLTVEVDEEAGTATSRCYVTVFQALPGFPLQPVAAGRYNDRFAATGAGGSWNAGSASTWSATSAAICGVGADCSMAPGPAAGWSGRRAVPGRMPGMSSVSAADYGWVRSSSSPFRYELEIGYHLALGRGVRPARLLASQPSDFPGSSWCLAGAEPREPCAGIGELIEECVLAGAWTVRNARGAARRSARSGCAARSSPEYRADRRQRGRGSPSGSPRRPSGSIRVVPGRVGRPEQDRLAILNRERHSLPGDKEHGMPTDPVGRFLAALDPDHRKVVGAKPQEEQERLAAAWERELESDDELDTLDELSPSAAEAEAARRVMEDRT